MAPNLRELVEQAQDWPEEDQNELADYAREIRARRTGTYLMTDDEWSAVQIGLGQADRGEFVPAEMVAEADKRRGL